MKGLSLHCLTQSNLGLNPSQDASSYVSRYVNNSGEIKRIALILMKDIVRLIEAESNQSLFKGLDVAKLKSVISSKLITVSKERLFDEFGSSLDSKVENSILI